MEEVPELPPSLVRSSTSATTVPYFWVDDSVCLCTTAVPVVWSDALGACVCGRCFLKIDPCLN